MATISRSAPIPPALRPAAAPRRRWAGLRSIVALMLREMSTRYGRTPGGYIWAVAEPVGALVILTAVFALMLRSPPLGSSFILFFTSGYLPYVLFMTVSSSVQNALTFSKPLLYYPAVSWIDALLARLILNVLVTATVGVIVFFGVLHFTEATAILNFGPMVLSMALSALLGFGVGTLNCYLVGMFPAWGQLWMILTRPLFLVAGVIFLFENLPAAVQDIAWYTPWIHLTAIFRTGVYTTYQPDYISIPLILAWTLIPMVLGLLLLRRNHREILLR